MKKQKAYEHKWEQHNKRKAKRNQDDGERADDKPKPPRYFLTLQNKEHSSCYSKDTVKGPADP